MSAAVSPQLEPARILFVDDHRLLLEALALIVAPQYRSFAIDSLSELEEAVVRFRPNLVVMDIAMPEGDGVLSAQRLLRSRPGLKLILLSMYNDAAQVRRALDCGAHGFLTKRSPAAELLTAIEKVLLGERYISSAVIQHSSLEGVPLTDRQRQVLRLVAQGLSAKEIATKLNISVRTAEFHRGSIMQRLGLRSTALITRYAVEHNLL